jgi:peptidyl-prolyl cis-trans isomerase A (cyclophilin A)
LFVWAVMAFGLPIWAVPSTQDAPSLLNPDAPEFNRPAPEAFNVRLETSKGPIVVGVHRAWAPRGADRFYNLVRAGYYDDTRFFRVVANKWAQFGINGNPAIAQAWRSRTIPDDPRKQSNVRGTMTFAFAVPNGRATQVFIALTDLSASEDAQGFAPFGRVEAGMDVADSLNSEYGEGSGSGIRAGKQQPLFDGGNAYMDREFPRLDRIVRATVIAKSTEQTGASGKIRSVSDGCERGWGPARE